MQHANGAATLSIAPLLLLPPLKVFDALRALPAQSLTVNANVESFPPLASEHQPTAQIAAPAAGREFAGVEGEFHGCAIQNC